MNPTNRRPRWFSSAPVVLATLLVLRLCATITAADILKLSVDPASGQLTAGRNDSNATWRAAALANVSYWDTTGKETGTAITPASGWKFQTREIAGGARLVASHETAGLAIAFDLITAGDVLTACAPAAEIKESGQARLKILRLLPGLCSAVEGDPGHLVIAQQSGALCLFKDKKPAESYISVYQSSCQAAMPLFGIVRDKSAVAGIITGGQFDARFCVSTNWGKEKKYAIDPVFALRSFKEEQRLADDIKVEYHLLPQDQSSWIGIGKRYRQFNTQQRALRPLGERIKQSPQLAYSADALEVRVRLGVKPVPCETKEQTPQTEPPLRIFCNFVRLRDIFNEFKKQAISKVEFCLVGWNRGGHDGRYPQIFPPEPALGGEGALRETIKHGQNLGYQVVAHDCYYDAYNISEDFSQDILRKDKDQKTIKGGAWGGGQSYNLCMGVVDQRFAPRDMPRERALGFSGVHYSDVISIIGPRPCYDPNHPLTRRQDAEAVNRILALAQKTFGGSQSEGSLDFTAPVIDRMLYVDCDKWLPLAKRPYVDVRVPLFEVVYHGVVIYNLSTESVNTLPGEEQYLRSIEYGAAPLAYFYGHFVMEASKNWLGQRDYRYDDAAGLSQQVSGLRKVYEDYQKLKHLQLETLDSHREIAPGVFETTYSNDQRSIVNYNDQPFTLPAGQAVAPRSWLLLDNR